MRDLITALGFVVILLFSFYRPVSDSIFLHWYWGLSVLTVVIAVRLHKYLSAPLLIWGCWLCLSAVYVFANRENMYSGNPTMVKAILSIDAAYGMIAVLVFGVFFLVSGRGLMRLLRDYIGVLGILNAAFVVIGAVSWYLASPVFTWLEECGGKEVWVRDLGTPWLFDWIYTTVKFLMSIGKVPGGDGFSGFLSNQGVNGSFIVCCLPFAVEYVSYIKRQSKHLDKWVLAVLMLSFTACLLSASSIVYGVMIVGLISWFIGSSGISGRVIVNAFAVCGLVLLCGLWVEGEQLFNSRGRFQVYGLFLNYWYDHLPRAFGSGLSTFPVFSPDIQIVNKFLVKEGVGHFFTFMHSDWLQTLFETGIIGFVLSVWLYLWTLAEFYRRKDRAAFASFASIGGAMLFNFPVRYFLGAFLLAFLGVLGNGKIFMGPSEGSNREV